MDGTGQEVGIGRLEGERSVGSTKDGTFGRHGCHSCSEIELELRLRD